MADAIKVRRRDHDRRRARPARAEARHRAAVERMTPGTVIVDLAAETGGNCELSVPGQTVVRHDVKIVAPLNVPSKMAEHASQLYARNIQSLLELIVVAEGELELDFDDEMVAGACITRDGEIVRRRQGRGQARRRERLTKEHP